MHIEPGVVVGAKAGLGFATAFGGFAWIVKQSMAAIRRDGFTALGVRSFIATLMVFCFFQVLPHFPVGVSEVHFILGSTLFLMFGAAPAAIGLSLGLLLQGLLFAPLDLPQYGMNVTSLVLPLLAIHFLARRIIPANTAYKDIQYRHALALSSAFQGGVVAWVAFWAVYGQGFGAENMTAIASFGVTYLMVIAVEPLIDLGVLASVKSLHKAAESGVFHSRMHHGAAV